MENQRESPLQQRKKRRVILFPLPLQGHINPMLQLANILYGKGLSITVIHTNFNSPNTSNYPHFDFCSIPDGLLEVGASTSDVIALVTLLNVNCVVPFRDCLAKLLSNVEEESIACLITDAVCHFTQAVADSLKLPRIVLRTSSISSFLAFAAISLLHEKGFFPIKGFHFLSDLGSEAPMPEFPSVRVKDIPLIETRDAEKFYQLLMSMMSQIKASSGLIWNSFQDLEQDALPALERDFRIPIFPIGAFHKYFPASSSSLLTQDKSSISWLDKQAPKSVLYVSFGSIAAVNEAEFLEIAWGLANSGVPFLWVVRPGLVRGFEWLEPLPKGFLEMLDGRAHIVKWAPQQEVLAHPATGGFWTHNGWNSTLESICEGVPMICQPCFGDQLVIARYVSHIWRVGLHLEKRLERGEIETAIRRVILEAEGQEMRDRIMQLKEKVDVSLRQGGSSYQSLESLISYIESF
ncbi:hypothetical protein Patl1_06498 [Pistacia atlantica]|uniref:Uncharacterized protein n=1 Tax=Pistacia atlantica TaxID=434234 RepID=A0ACC1BUU6_9ROSI|nr:hypothetical protein Patl1_06498 [Pistacia atlantica]